MGNKKNQKKLTALARKRILHQNKLSKRNKMNAFTTLIPVDLNSIPNRVNMEQIHELTPEGEEVENRQHISETGYIENCDLTIEGQQEEKDYHGISGRRIIDINYFMNQLQEKSHHNDLFDCKLGYFKLIGEKRNGLLSKFKFECNICRTVMIIDSENPYSTECVNLNVAAVTGIIASGIGYSQFEELHSAMDVPIFSSNMFEKIQNHVYDNWEKTACESMEAAAKREKEAALAEGRVKNGIPLIDVYVDGAWSSRSYGNNYRAMSGSAAIIGKKFGEVLFMGVKNKYCMICSRAQKKGLDPKQHKCFKNFYGSSGSMEAEIICEGFKASLEMYGVIYARMIGDGDSSTYAKILETNPYEHHVVEKIECRNHILRNLCNKLRAVTKDTKYNIIHRKSLTNEKIMSMRKVIVKSIKYHKRSDDSKSTSITKLHNDIINAVPHAYGDHRLCNDYNCTKNKDLGNCTIKQIENTIFLFRIKSIIGTAAGKSRSLIEDVDTHHVERFNSIIAKFVGGKRINFALRRGYQTRCAAAVVSYNDGSSISSVQKQIVGKSPTGQIKRLEKKRSLKRKYNLDHPTKKTRKLYHLKPMEHDYGPRSSAPDMNDIELENAKQIFISNLRDLVADREAIERCTVLQKDSSQWIEIRKKLLTASNFGTVCKRRLTINSAPLVKNILYKRNIAHVKSIAHGIEHEKQALQQIEVQEGITIKPCGLFIDKNIPFIGATPDGLVRDDTIVEVKCPITALRLGLDNAIKENKIQIFKFNKVDNIRTINKKSNWFYQIQGQLHITERRQCLLGIWTSEDQPVLIEVIEKDDNFWKKNMEEQIINFYSKCLLPEIVDPRHIRGMPIRNATLKNDKENIRPPFQQKSRQSISETATSERTHEIDTISTSHKVSMKPGPNRLLDFSEY